MNDRSLFRRPRFLQSTARSLKEACQEVGRDEGGQRCPDCPVRDLCEDELRWLVKPDRRQSTRLH